MNGIDFEEIAAVPLEDQIASVIRELGMREKCYPRWVREKIIPAADSRQDTIAMLAVLRTLLQLEATQAQLRFRDDFRKRAPA